MSSDCLPEMLLLALSGSLAAKALGVARLSGGEVTFCTTEFEEAAADPRCLLLGSNQ